jgi:hypothetical protein
MLQTKAVQPATLALLKKIASLEELSSFALGGGTNLALRYGHRLSVDLDFFSCNEFDRTTLFKLITKQFPSSELMFEQNQTMLFFIDEVRVDFVLYPFPWLRPFEILDAIRFISEKDIIPMKLQAVSNRYSKKDFWDIAYLLRRYTVEDMITIFKEKFPQIDTGFIIHSLTNFSEAEEQLDPDSLDDTSWDDVKESLSEAVKGFTKRSI